MKKPMEPSPAMAERLTSRRLDFEARFESLRNALDREIGWAPRTKTWVLPMVAFAGGLAIAGFLAARRRRGGDA